ncbi:DHA2 family efflux MFS transporter permease subunit [Sandaracinobacteroides sp. A072]|uniref:DHA2 family efflux MFS transporter permease subunit n=1 Tax=Sandaracinobacteroides sp. A072 TaxID=3461146 RepID=UPI004041E81F
MSAGAATAGEEAAAMPGGGLAPGLGADAKPDPAALAAFLLMALGMFMAVLDIQIVAASLGQIQAGLSASADEIAWVQTSYLIAEVVMIPLSGFLSRALSTRWLFVISSALFTVASLICAMVTTIEGMIAARAFQGFVGGAMIPTVYAASFMLFGRQRQALVTVAMSFVITMAPTIGPALGGWLTGVMSWHWLFLINIIPGIFITLGVALLVKLPDEPNPAILRKTDFPGLLALALLCGGLVFVLEDGARRQWFEDEHIRFWSAMVVMAAFALWWRIRTAEEPIVRLDAFTNVNFAAGTLMGGVFGIALYGLVYLYPLYLGRVADLSSAQIGTTVFVTGLSMMLTTPIAGLFASRVDPRVQTAIGFLLLATSTWMTTGITNEWRFWELALPQVLRGAGIMLSISSVSIMAFATLPPEQLKDSTGLFTLMRNIGGAIGIAIINTLLTVRGNLHQARLAESANPGRPEIAAWLEGVAQMATERGLADPDGYAVRLLGGLIRREATVMAIADSFLVLSALFVLMVLVPAFLRKPGTFEDPVQGH